MSHIFVCWQASIDDAFRDFYEDISKERIQSNAPLEATGARYVSGTSRLNDVLRAQLKARFGDDVDFAQNRAVLGWIAPADDSIL